MSGHSLLQTLLQATDFTRPPGPRLYRTPQPSVDYPKPDRSCHERESGGENAKSNFPTQGIDAESLPGSFLSTLVPCAAASSAIQVLFGILSVIYQTEKGYDLAGGVGFYTALATGFVVPVLRRRERERLVAEASSGHRHTKGDAKEYNWNALSLKRDWDWRQLALTGSTFVWAFRVSSYLFTRVLRWGLDSRFNRTRYIPHLFAIPWCGQALWVICVCMPAIAVNSIPLSAFEALSAQGNVEARSRDSKGHGQWAETESGGEEAGKKREFGVTTTEKLGMILFLFGFAVENLADYRKSNWWDEKRRKLHNEDFLTKGLWERSQYPNYFGEITLQLGSFVFASGILSRKHVQRALCWQTPGSGYTDKLTGTLKAILIPALAPDFTTLTLLKLSGIPLSQRKYDRRYGHCEECQR